MARPLKFYLSFPRCSDNRNNPKPELGVDIAGFLSIGKPKYTRDTYLGIDFPGGMGGVWVCQRALKKLGICPIRDWSYNPIELEPITIKRKENP